MALLTGASGVMLAKPLTWTGTLAVNDHKIPNPVMVAAATAVNRTGKGKNSTGLLLSDPLRSRSKAICSKI
jgi:hypothetical protein